MTTIKLKNGSGAPLAGDLVQGEPALDLTNKRLYTEDSGGTVIEVGTNPTSVTTGGLTTTGSVGIGTSSPDTLVQASNTSASTNYISYEIGSSGISSANKGGFAIYELGVLATSITYTRDGSGHTDFNANTLVFNNVANTTEYMRIDASGNLLVGKTGTSTLATDTTAGHTLYNIGIARHVASGSPSLQLTRTSSDGDIAVFTKDGSTVGSINSWSQSGSSRISMVNPNGNGVGIFRESSTFASIVPITNGASGDGDHGLGRADYRWKDLYLSGGVYLGGTGSANKLDDYERGTWTPTVIAGFSGFSVQDANYVKIGEQCTVFMWVSNPTGATSSLLRIGGLPFNSASGVYGHIGNCIAYGSNNTSKANTVYLGDNSSEVILTDAATTGTFPVVGVSGLSVGNGTSIQITLTYYTG